MYLDFRTNRARRADRAVHSATSLDATATADAASNWSHNQKARQDAGGRACLESESYAGLVGIRETSRKLANVRSLFLAVWLLEYYHHVGKCMPENKKAACEKREGGP